MKIRTLLSLLSWGSMAPALILGACLIVFLVDAERAESQRAVRQQAHALVGVFDAALAGSISALSVLAEDEAFDRGDYTRLRELMLRASRHRPEWINVTVATPDGVQRVNLSAPAGAKLPSVLDQPNQQAAIDSQTARVGLLSKGQLTGRMGMPLSLPVLRNGRITHVITAVLTPDGIQQLLAAQPVPPGWVVAVADRQQHFIARVPAVAPGNPVAPGFANAIRSEAHEGDFRARTVEGVDTYQYFVRSFLSDWIIGIAVPVKEVNATAVSMAGLILAGSLFTLALVWFLVRHFSRRISRPIQALGEAATQIGQAGVPAMQFEGIDELAEVKHALIDADAALRERDRLRQLTHDELIRSDQAKDQFIAMLGHELRNPLAAISSATLVLRHVQQPTPEGSAALAIVERQTAHMTRLIRDLLDVNAIALGKVTLDRQPLVLDELVGQVLDSWQMGGRLGRRPLERDIHPASVEGDRGRLEQVLVNLLDNAVKFSPDGSPIEVRLVQHGDRARLSVADHGAGIDPAIRPSIFGAFVQAKQPLDRKSGGLGLGLALVEQLVHLHGGRVTVQSEGIGKGASFMVELPLAHPEA